MNPDPENARPAPEGDDAWQFQEFESTAAPLEEARMQPRYGRPERNPKEWEGPSAVELQEFVSEAPSPEELAARERFRKGEHPEG